MSARACLSTSTAFAAFWLLSNLTHLEESGAALRNIFDEMMKDFKSYD